MGNAYLTGVWPDAERFPDVQDAFLRKYSSAGDILWTTVIEPTSDARAIALDGVGNIFVSGNHGASYIRKFTADGLELWHAVPSSPGIATGEAIAVAPNGSVYVAETTAVLYGPFILAGRVVKLAPEPDGGAIAAIGAVILGALRCRRLKPSMHALPTAA